MPTPSTQSSLCRVDDETPRTTTLHCVVNMPVLELHAVTTVTTVTTVTGTVDGEACEHFREELVFHATADPRAQVMQVDAVISAQIHPP